MSTRLLAGWAMIAAGYLGMTVHLWFTTTWLWYLLQQEEKSFWAWLAKTYS